MHLAQVVLLYHRVLQELGRIGNYLACGKLSHTECAGVGLRFQLGAAPREVHGAKLLTFTTSNFKSPFAFVGHAE